MEQVRLLGHDADDLAERRERDPPDVDAVDLDRAGVDVVQPRDQVRRRRLAAAGRTDQGDELAGLGLEVDALEPERRHELDGRHGRQVERVGLLGRLDERLDRRLIDGGRGDRAARRRPRSGAAPRRPWRRAPAGRDGLGRVAEGDVAEADPAADRGRVEGHRVGRVDDLGIHLEVLEDPVEQGQRALDLDLDVEQLAEREEQPGLERREGDDVADRRGVRVALAAIVAGQPVHERRRDAEDRADDHEEPAADHRLADLERGQVLR